MKKKRRDKKLKKYNDSYNRHHLINSSRWWNYAEENIRKTKVSLHNALHYLFWNETPAEILRTLMVYFDKVFTEEFRKDIFDVLNKHYWKEHQKKCHNWPIKWWWASSLLNKDIEYGK